MFDLKRIPVFYIFHHIAEQKFLSQIGVTDSIPKYLQRLVSTFLFWDWLASVWDWRYYKFPERTKLLQFFWFIYSFAFGGLIHNLGNRCQGDVVLADFPVIVAGAGAYEQARPMWKLWEYLGLINNLGISNFIDFLCVWFSELNHRTITHSKYSEKFWQKASVRWSFWIRSNVVDLYWNESPNLGDFRG